MTAFESIRVARETLATLRDVPADVLAEVLTADRALQVASDLLIEARVVPTTYDEQGDFERLARSGR